MASARRRRERAARRRHSDDRDTAARLTRLGAPTEGLYAATIELKLVDDTYHDPGCSDTAVRGAPTVQLSIAELSKQLTDYGADCRCLYDAWAKSESSQLLVEVQQLGQLDEPSVLAALGVAVEDWLCFEHNKRLTGADPLYAWWANTIEQYPRRLAAWAQLPNLITEAHQLVESRWLDVTVEVWANQIKRCGSRRRARMHATRDCPTLAALHTMHDQQRWSKRRRQESLQLHQELRTALAGAWQEQVWVQMELPQQYMDRSLLGIIALYAPQPIRRGTAFFAVPKTVAVALQMANATIAGDVEADDSVELAEPAAALVAAGMPASEALNAARLLVAAT